MKNLQELLSLTEQRHSIEEGLNEGFIDLTPDQERAIANEISDHLGTDVEVTSVKKTGDVFTAFFSYDDTTDNVKGMIVQTEKVGKINFTGVIKGHSVDNIVFKSKAVYESIEDMDLDTLIDNWMDKEKIYHMEGPAGYRNLSKLIRLLGYREMTDFLEDNSGAVEAIIDWVKNQNFPEWKNGFEAYAGNKAGDEE